MARKPVLRSLPALKRFCPQFRGFSPDVNQAQELLAVLRRIARRVQSAKSRPFYSMFEVAGFFGVSYSTVARTYARLENEGFLNRVRGSQTLLLPRKPRPRQAVRGVVAVPIWIPGFINFRYWRIFAIRLEEELRRRQFVADLIFYRQGEETHPDFKQRVLSHHPDFLVWFEPDKADVSTLLALKDSGLRLMILSDRIATAAAGVYRLSWRHALQEGLREWRRRGVTCVETPVPHGSARSGSALHLTDSILADSGMSRRFRAPRTADLSLSKYVNSLGAGRSLGVVFDEDSWFEMLCDHAPDAMISLFRRAPVMVMHPFTLPVDRLEPSAIDVLRMDWKSVAAQIARDLVRGGASPSKPPSMFHARWHPRVPLDQMAQTWRQE